MHKLETFKNENFGAIRTIQIENEVWFVGKDVATALGYDTPSKVITRYIDKNDRIKYPLADNLGRTQQMWVINESGLYSLILSIKLPSSKEFKYKGCEKMENNINTQVRPKFNNFEIEVHSNEVLGG